jgi:AcrR family transcriptional regulator
MWLAVRTADMRDAQDQDPTAPSPRPTPRWQRRKQARPAEIVAAALDVFVERGYAATKLADVARRAGVTKGTMYLYFESKEALFKAVIRQSLLPYLERAEQLVTQYRGDTRDLLATLIRSWWEAIGESRVSGIPKLVIAEASNFPDLARFYHDEVIQRGQRVAARVIQRGMDRGEFREVDITATIRLALAPVLFATLWKHSFRPYDPQPFDARAFVEQHLDFFLRAIAKGAPGESAHA